MTKKTERGSHALLSLLVAAVTFFICLLFGLRGIDPYRDGLVLKNAIDVVHGATLFSGTYTQYGSLFVYLMAASVRLFGETVMSLRIATALAYALSGFTLYHLCRRFMPRPAAFAVPLLTLALASFYFQRLLPLPSVFSLLFTLITSLFFVRYIERSKRRELFFAGMFAAAAFWCRIPALLTLIVGVLFLVGLLVSGRYRGEKHAFARALTVYLLGNLLLSAAFFGILYKHGSFDDWWVQSVRNAFAFAFDPTAGALIKLLPSLGKTLLVGLELNPRFDWIFRVLTYGSALYLIVLVVLVFVKRDAPDRSPLYARIAFAAFAVSGWANYVPILSYRSMFLADYAMLGVLAAAVADGAGILIKKPVPAEEPVEPAPKAVKVTEIPLGAPVIDMSRPAEPARKKRRAPLRLTERKRSALIALIVLALILPLTWPSISARAEIGFARLTGSGAETAFVTDGEYFENEPAVRYHSDAYPFVNGLYLSEREAGFYDRLYGIIDTAKDRYPAKNIVNTSSVPLFSCFSLENVHPGMFGEVCEGYPEQADILREHIDEKHPILIAVRPYKGYAVLAELSGFGGDAPIDAPMYVLVPE